MQIFFKQLLMGLSLLCFSQKINAQWEVQPKIHWKTLTTPHFEVIFDAEQQDLGLLYGEKLEKAYEQLRPYFTEAPERTIVVINDKTDITNGYATRIPYPHIVAYPVLPGPEDSLADTGDWAFELLAHEYTHILSFEPAHGIMSPLRSIFGTVIAPNLLLPNWWKEGLAVEMETRLGQKGRLRSVYQDATLRAMVEDQSLFYYDLAEANEYIPTWPKGSRPYIFGSLMWSQILEDKGARVIDQLTQRHGRRIPYFVETPAKEYLDRSYSEEYSHALQETELRTQAQLKTLREVLPTPYVQPRNAYLFLTAPSVAPDGRRMAVVTEDDAHNRAIKIISRPDNQTSFLDAKQSDTVEKFDQNFNPGASKDEPPSGSIQRISWFPDSTKIVYDKVDVTNRVERFSDIYMYDILTGKTQALTHGLRAREPSVSPDSRRIAFVKLEGGRTHLGLLTLNGQNRSVEIIYSAPLQQRVSYPTFLDDGTIVFSLRSDLGEEYLYKFSFATNSVEKILPDFPNARFAKMTEAGLLFASSKNGTSNIYLAGKNLATARPLTHTLTALFSADLDPIKEELFATMMTSKGPKVAAFKASDWKTTPQELPQIEPLFADRYKSNTEEAAKAEAQAKAAVHSGSLDDYSATSYLLPHYWIPFIVGTSTETGVVLQAMTSGFDPLKKHSYTLLGTWDTGINRGSLDGSYLNQVTSLPFLLNAFRRSTYLGTVDNKMIDTGFSGAVLPDMFWLSRYATLQIGWQYFDRTAENSTSINMKRTGPSAFLLYTNFNQSGAQISPESGLSAYLGAYNYIQYQDYLHHSQFTAGGTMYFSSFLPKHNSFMLKLNGIYTPEKIPSIYGASTESIVFKQDNPFPEYIMRGYNKGQFYGRDLVNLNAEYRFPIWNIYDGTGTDPIFWRRLTGAITLDGVATNGKFINQQGQTAADFYQDVTLQRTFWSAGLEGHLETTLGYIAPVNFVLGVYRAFNQPNGGETAIQTAIQVTGF
ncbi:MAG: TolB family protein [Bacillota bacterium]